MANILSYTAAAGRWGAVVYPGADARGRKIWQTEDNDDRPQGIVGGGSWCRVEYTDQRG